jgi:hypothetical protein
MLCGNLDGPNKFSFGHFGEKKYLEKEFSEISFKVIFIGKLN